MGRGAAGERGKTGDHGQQGDEGRRGEQGIQGERGKDGVVGVTGKRGITGSRMSKSQLAAYVGLVIAALYGFYQGERADDRSIRDREVLCERSIVNRTAIRDIYSDVAELGREIAKGSDRQAELNAAFNQFQKDRLTEYPALKPPCPTT